MVIFMNFLIQNFYLLTFMYKTQNIVLSNPLPCLSFIFAQMTALGTFRVLCEPLLHVKHMTAMRTALTPSVQPLDDSIAHAAFRTLHRFAFAAIATL